MVKVNPKGKLCRGRAEVIRDRNNKVGEARSKIVTVSFFHSPNSNHKLSSFTRKTR